MSDPTKEIFRANVEEQQGVLSMTTGSDHMHKLCVKPEVTEEYNTSSKYIYVLRLFSNFCSFSIILIWHFLCKCIKQGTLKKPVVFSLSLSLGHSDSYYEEMAAAEHLDRLQLEVSIHMEI